MYGVASPHERTCTKDKSTATHDGRQRAAAQAPSSTTFRCSSQFMVQSAWPRRNSEYGIYCTNMEKGDLNAGGRRSMQLGTRSTDLRCDIFGREVWGLCFSIQALSRVGFPSKALGLACWAETPVTCVVQKAGATTRRAPTTVAGLTFADNIKRQRQLTQHRATQNVLPGPRRSVSPR